MHQFVIVVVQSSLTAIACNCSCFLFIRLSFLIFCYSFTEVWDVFCFSLLHIPLPVLMYSVHLNTLYYNNCPEHSNCYQIIDLKQKTNVQYYSDFILTLYTQIFLKAVGSILQKLESSWFSGKRSMKPFLAICKG